MADSDNIDIIKQRLIELEEQLRVSDEDNKRKDEHIKALSSMEIKRGISPGNVNIECKAEVASLQLQLSFLQDKLTEKENEYRDKGKELSDLLCDRIGLQENIDTLNIRVRELEAQVSSAEKLMGEDQCANARSELAISTLQRELDNATAKIVELEAQIKSTECNRNLIEQSKAGLSENINQFYKDLTVHLNLEVDSEPNDVLSKIKQLTHENHSTKGEIDELKKVAEKREEKYLESRDALRAMMQGMDSNKGDLEEYIRAKKELTNELEKLNHEMKKAEHKNEELENKISDLEALLKDTRNILNEKEAQLLKIDLERRETSYSASNVHREFDGFRETLSGLLGSTFKHCPINEESIKERVKALVCESKEKDHTIRQLEERLKTISDQYERNFENSKDTEVKARRIELEYLDLKDRIRQLEKELSVRDVSRDELRGDKEKFYHFLRRLAAILKMDPYSSENDLSLILEGIMERTTQVIRAENDRNIDTNQTIISLQKRLRNLKDQLHSRDLHLELMRKKLTNQDDQLREAFDEVQQTKDVFEREDSSKQKLAKMQKKIEQLRDENKALKAELFDCSDAKIALENQTKEIETLQHNLGKLERVRQRQAERIADLSKNIELCDAETNQTKFVSDNAVQSLASELRTMRNALDRARRSEQEILDFRKVVGRMLGLNVDDLAIPNYDIIRRLEKLVSIPTSGITMAVPVQHYPIRPGYEDANRLLGRQRRSPHRKLYADSGRPRSVSPLHEGRDHRKY